MKVTENLRAAILCLERNNRHFMEVLSASPETRQAALSNYPVGTEIPQRFATELRHHMELATERAKLGNGQVCFHWGLVPSGVDLLLPGDSPTDIHNTSFTLESLFQ